VHHPTTPDGRQAKLWIDRFPGPVRGSPERTLRSGAHGGVVDVECGAHPVGHPLGDLPPAQQVVELDAFRPDDQVADLTFGPQMGTGARLRTAARPVAALGAGGILPGAVGPDHLQPAVDAGQLGFVAGPNSLHHLRGEALVA